MSTDGQFVHGPLKGRVRYTSPNPLSGDASITISNLRLSDTGTYDCDFWTKMDGNKMLPPQANVDATMGHLFVDRITEDDCGTYLCTVESLTCFISENHPAEVSSSSRRCSKLLSSAPILTPAFFSFVLVLTFCTLKANSQTSYYAAVGSNITLHCKHTYPTDNFDILWDVWLPSQALAITSWHCGVFYKPLKGRVHHMPHSFQTSHCKGDASITISNLRLSDTGTYTCHSRNPVMDEIREMNMNLTVMEKPSEPICGVTPSN
ncbi:coxsackievirus and adenovirus receptor homolog [Dunckerocampus dactyliophorus]|uniref:coxsackievirus and adenovirus receptor homolog n=1 Tax=Dunckerocampus dactyliophorus TaxID=161453 RepID=UPI002405D0D4|nr:coxsackievirus and adenovirus receptor homolog [Dunckerocampus dactyliophorus]